MEFTLKRGIAALVPVLGIAVVGAVGAQTLITGEPAIDRFPNDAFLEAVGRRNIELLPVSYKEARRLGCNVLSLDGRTIVSGTSTPRISAMLRRSGFEVLEVDLDELAACGGGVHCLTMPLERRGDSLPQSR